MKEHWCLLSLNGDSPRSVIWQPRRKKGAINMPLKERYTERAFMHFAVRKFTWCVPSWVTYVEYSIYDDFKNQDILVCKWKLLMLSFCN